MATQNEILRMQEELKRIQEQTRKSRRRAGIGFGLLVFALVLSFVYAFVQQVAAERNAEEALRQAILAKDSQQMAVAKEKQALQAEEDAMLARDLAENCQGELAKCRASKK